MSKEISPKKENRIVEITRSYAPVLPIKCGRCKTKFKQIDIDDEKIHSLWQPVCDCYEEGLKISVV